MSGQKIVYWKLERACFDHTSNIFCNAAAKQRNVDEFSIFHSCCCIEVGFAHMDSRNSPPTPATI
jgi:hypothetical protein